jgi:hypothetical protein
MNVRGSGTLPDGSQKRYQGLLWPDGTITMDKTTSEPNPESNGGPDPNANTGQYL